MDTTETVRHVKRGTTYTVLHRGVPLQCSADVWEDAELVVYRGEDGKVWARPEEEFDDGRFVPASPPPPAGEPLDGSTVTIPTVAALEDLAAENAELRKALEDLRDEVKRHEEHNDAADWYACGWDFDALLAAADAALAKGNR